MRRLLALSLACLALLTGGGKALAHEIRPALLEIVESEPGAFEVTWKVPIFEGKPLVISPRFPQGMQLAAPPARRQLPGAVIEQSVYRYPGGSLVGETIGIDGLSALQIDTLVQLTLADGTHHSAILRPKSPEWTVPARASTWEVAGSYWVMGTIHILEGIDHLLFVLALMLLVPGYWQLLKTITAFTVSHSISLGLATLGFVNMPAGPVEAVIALSILFLAVEIIHSRQGRVGVTERYPWLVAFFFGLFHGLGFAGALSEVGLPQGEIPVALLMFNVGVETGQILFLSAVLLVMAGLRRLSISWPAGSWRVLPYAIGSMAAFWTIQRVDGFLYL